MKSAKQWILTDRTQNIQKEKIELNARQLGAPKCRKLCVTKTTLRGGLSEGVEVVEINNGALSISVIPTRGMGIWRGSYRGIFLGWRSPVEGPVHPAFVHQNERGGLGWLYGFDECIVRCGLESNGAPGRDVVPNNMGEPTEMELTLHGRIANIPASRVTVEASGGAKPIVSVSGIVEETMLFGPRFRLSARISTAPGANWFRIEDEVSNLRAVESEMELLYHCNFGGPVLEEGARLVLPALETAPRSAYRAEDVETWAVYRGPTPGFVEQCFWHVLRGDANGGTMALLRNAAGDLGVCIRFNLSELPCFTQWKNTAAEEDGYVTGLEPGTNYPNTRAFERKQGRVPRLAPGSSRRASLTVEVLDSARLVKAAEDEIEKLRGGTAHTLHRAPDPRFSA